MKNIHPFTFFVILFILAGIEVWGEIRIFNQPYSFSMSTGPGFLYGTAYEIVYKSSGSDDYVSELQWNMKPLLYWKLDLELAPQKPMQRWGPFFGLGIKAGLPMETGDMEDRDWLKSKSPGSLTHFSSHDNHTKAAFLVNLGTGLSFPLRKVLFKVHLQADYMYFKWEARDGYIQYGPNDPGRITTNDPNTWFDPWNSGFKKEPLDGLGITYQQHWILINTGIGADVPLGRFTLSGTLFFSPLVVCIAIDEHHLRDFTTTALLFRGLSLKPKLGISFLVNDHFELELFGSYLWIGETRGNIKEEKQNETNTYKNLEGARFSAFEGGLGLRFWF
jgi:outer membrane protease